MKKLIIQIPCHNEEKTLPLVLKDIPKNIDGIDIIETQIIDDGSTDKTVVVAKKYGVTHIISHIGNKGLGNAFCVGVEKALEEGVSILVNTDGDNQYKSSDISKLVKPIVDKKADVVIGNRQIKNIKHFSFIKKILYFIGNKALSMITGQKIPDAVSGFRAYSREALLEINVTSNFSYVIETIIQAAEKRIKMIYVDIKTNPPTRESRLFKSIFQYIKESLIIIISVCVMYKSTQIFFSIGTIFLIAGLIPVVDFFVNNQIHTQLLIFGAICIIVAFQMYGLSIIGIQLEKQRILTEKIMNKLKKNL